MEELDLNKKLKNGCYLVTHPYLKAVLLHGANKKPLISVAHADGME
jgi:hypothetical protein